MKDLSVHSTYKHQRTPFFVIQSC